MSSFFKLWKITYVTFSPHDNDACVSIIFAVPRCPSVTLVNCIHTAEDIIRLLSRPDSSIVFDFMRRYPVPRGTPSAGCKIHGGGKTLRFSTEITVYLGNDMR